MGDHAKRVIENPAWGSNSKKTVAYHMHLHDCEYLELGRRPSQATSLVGPSIAYCPTSHGYRTVGGEERKTPPKVCRKTTTMTYM